MLGLKHMLRFLGREWTGYTSPNTKIINRKFLLALIVTSMSSLILPDSGYAQTTKERRDELLSSFQKSSTTEDSLGHMINLAEVYQDLDSKEGEKYASWAVEIAEELNQHEFLLKAKLSLAGNMRLNSEFEEASQLAKEVLKSSENFTDLKAKSLLELGVINQLLHQHDTAISYFDKSILAFRDIGDTLNTSLNLAYKAHSYTRTGELQRALDLAERGLGAISKMNAKKEEAISLNFLGSVNVSLGQMSEASDYLFKALAIADSLENPRLQMNQLNEIGIIYAVQGENEESLLYFNKALDAAEQINSNRDYTGTLSNIAYIYSVLGNPDKSLEYYERVLEHNRSYGDECLSPFIYEGIARLYESINKPDSAFIYFQEILELSKRCQMMEYQISSLQGMGRHYSGKKQYRKAIESFTESYELAQTNNFTPLAHISSRELYQAYKQDGNYSKALEYHELMMALDDSIYSEKNKKEILRLTAKYEFDKEKQLLQAKQEREEIQFEEDLKRQILHRNYALGALGLTLMLIGTLWWMYSNKRKANAQLFKLNREKNELIGVVAHDLRNPLNNINNLMLVLKEELGSRINDDHKDYFRFIEKSSLRMNDMIERVLDVNAIESESLNMNLQVWDLAEILHFVADSFKLPGEKKGIEIERNLPVDQFYALIDRNYAIQVFENLVSNALKFSPSGSKIVVELTGEGDLIYANVKDQGPGITQEDKKMLFKRFAKLSARPTGTESSVGLGLSIVKRYVDAMNGQIDAVSNNGSGTVFTVQFSLAKS